MKNYLIIVTVLLIPIFGINAQSYEIFKGDTINYSDENSNKQGKWIVFKSKTQQKLKEGSYLQGKKEGAWKSYYVNGNIKSEITYIQGKKRGHAKIFYENGNIAEEGTWLTDKWVGKYTSYYQNGKRSYLWNYNDYGARSGYQKYFYENGNIKIEGDWKNGKEQGTIKEYYKTGGLKLERNFLSGKCDEATIKRYSKEEAKKLVDLKIKKDKVTEEESNKDTISKEKQETIDVFSGNGRHVFYNKNKQVEREGEFINGILTDGKHYIYNNSGELIKTTIYKAGKIIDVIINETESK